MRLFRAALITALAVGLIVFVPSAGATAPDPVQRGLDIDGEAVSDESGWSVALSADGLTVAIGAPKNDGGGSNAGHVRIYGWDGSVWIRRGADIDGAAANDQSGQSVALSADGLTVAIGAPGPGGASSLTKTGSVRIYRWDDSAWVPRGAVINGQALGDRSGYSVALSDDGLTVAIGAIGNDGAGSNAGNARIYRWDGNVWGQQGGDLDGEAASDNSGFSVALSADGLTVAIGAPQNDGAGSNAGNVRVHRWDDSGSAWVQRGSDIDGEAAEDWSGYSVGLSADGLTVAIGAHWNDGNGNRAGHVRVHQWNGTAWAQRGADIDGEAAYDNSGFSVALSADGLTVAIGAPINVGTGAANSDLGHVRVHQWNGTVWVQRGVDIDGEAPGDNSGFSVALSADGHTVAIGATGNDGAGSNAGHVRILAFAVDGDDAGAVLPSSSPSVTCVPSVPVVGGLVTCAVTGGDAGIDILWRAAYNPTFAGAGVTLDASGSGEFSFTVPAAALGEELTVELVEWTAPVSLGVVGGPVPGSVPAGEGPVPVWTLGLLALVAVGLPRRGIRAQA